MTQQRLSNSDFFTQLTSLLNSTATRGHGSVFLTQKSLNDSQNSSGKSQVLIRATNGEAKPSKIPEKQKIAKTLGVKHEKRVKIATLVDADKLEDFYIKYAEVCKKGMEGLRKRDKKKAKEKAKKSKAKKAATTNGV